MHSQHRLLKAIRRDPVDKTPIWIMRQAGRYLPEYRAIRAKAGSFLKLCQTPALACEVTLQPIRRFPLDAAILFSDILTIPDALGLGLQFEEGRGPSFLRPLQSSTDINKLASSLDLNQLKYVYDAISLVKHELAGKIPLIGFCGSPWTLAAYMIEGQGKTGFPRALAMLNEDPKRLHKLLSLLSDAVTAHLSAQIKAGVDVVMVFDTWGGLLPKQDYLQFSLTYIEKIIATLKRSEPQIPFILFTKGQAVSLHAMADSGCDVLGLDSQVTLGDAREQVGSKVVLQGNLDPSCLLKSPEIIKTEVNRALASFGQGSGHIFNLGHGITPDVPPEHVAHLVDAVHEESKRYHQGVLA